MATFDFDGAEILRVELGGVPAEYRRDVWSAFWNDLRQQVRDQPTPDVRRLGLPAYTASEPWGKVEFVTEARPDKSFDLLVVMVWPDPYAPGGGGFGDTVRVHFWVGTPQTGPTLIDAADARFRNEVQRRMSPALRTTIAAMVEGSPQPPTGSAVTGSNPRAFYRSLRISVDGQPID